MKLSNVLTVSSLLSILFVTFHLTDDVLRNQSGGAQGVQIVIVVLALVVWLYGTLLLAERRWGYIINLVFSFLAAFIAVGHMTGVGDVAVGEIAKSSGPVFVWTVVALGVSAIFSLILSARLLFTPQTTPQRGKGR